MRINYPAQPMLFRMQECRNSTDASCIKVSDNKVYKMTVQEKHYLSNINKYTNELNPWFNQHVLLI